MRIRKKKWAEPELNACPYFIQNPASLRGNWAGWFPVKQPLHLELGCGKGSFIAARSYEHPEINYIAVDIKSDMLGVARRNVARRFEDRPVSNLALVAWNIEQIPKIMGDSDVIERIYINFCNPWPRGKHHKKRLTHPRQLLLYKHFLKENGELHFKTDDDGLFRDTLRYLEQDGDFQLLYETRDLHHSGYPDNTVTEHEIMFSEQGISIKFLIARYHPGTEKAPV